MVVAAMAVVVFVPAVLAVTSVAIPVAGVEARITSAVVCTFLRFFCCWICWLAETDLLLYSRLFCVRVVVVAHCSTNPVVVVVVTAGLGTVLVVVALEIELELFVLVVVMVAVVVAAVVVNCFPPRSASAGDSGCLLAVTVVVVDAVVELLLLVVPPVVACGAGTPSTDPVAAAVGLLGDVAVASASVAAGGGTR